MAPIPSSVSLVYQGRNRIGVRHEIERGIPVAHLNEKTIFLRRFISRKRIGEICVSHNSDFKTTERI